MRPAVVARIATLVVAALLAVCGMAMAFDAHLWHRPGDPGAARHRRLATAAGEGRGDRAARAAAASDGAPVVLLGDEVVEPYRNELAAGQAKAFRLRTRASGITAAVYLYVGAGTTARAVAVGIYGGANDKPGSLLSHGVSSSSLSPEAWSTVPITPTYLAAGRTYWLAVAGEGGKLRYRTRIHGACLSSPGAGHRRGPLPGVWKSGRRGARAHCPVSAYVVAAGPASDLSSPEPPAPASASEATPSTSATPELPGPSPPAAPVNTGLPVVSGPAVEGQTLSASTGSWSGSGISYGYQWEDCNSAGEACANIATATTSTYKLASTDVGHTLRVVVTATNSGGSANAASAATAVVTAPPPPPVNTALPVVSGSAVEGQTLSASTGSWSGSGISYGYQWEDCNSAGEACANIATATTSTYKLASTDVGHTLRVIVTATNTGGSAKAASAATAAVTLAPPVNTGLPVVSGSAVEGQTLSASTGSWTGSAISFAYQWEDCNTVGEGCANITTATAATYKLASTDVGHTLRVIVTATNTGGSANAASAATVVVTAPPPPPVNTELPAVSGSAVEGQTLSTTAGTWSGSGISYGYQWEDCNSAGEACANIATATAATYKLASTDVGHTLRVIVTATNTGGSAKATSAATAVVALAPPVNTGLPVVSGSAVEGQTLSASTGSWTGSAISFAYQWEDCNTVGEGCANITTATTATYKLASTDVGHTLRVVVTATNSDGSANATSAATVVVTAPLPPPVNTGLPAVSGSAVEGQTLSASTGSWTGSAISFAYQWEDCNTVGEGCANITTATAATYKLASTDVGHTLRVIVTATNTGGSAKATSAATVVVALAPPVNTALPVVSGSAVEGQTLSASTGAWSGSGISYGYQWEDCNTVGEACANITTATAATYKLASTDVGHTLRVIVTATNSGGSANAASAATVVVTAPLPPPVNTALPVVSGSAVEGQTLTASTGSWSGSGISYGYQWEDCNTVGEACANIATATTATYKLASTDVGHTLRVIVTATNTGGSAKATSAATVVVALAAPVNTGLPVVSGLAVEGQTLSTTSGSWSGSDISFGYQWEDCNSAGEGCANITTATTSTYKLASTDVGHTLRVVVTATNSGGSAKATSAATATVTSEGSTPENCFADPEGCGYPGPGTAGVANCSSLAKSAGTMTVTKSETIENTDITGYVTIDASKVTMKHDCVVINGGENYDATAVGLAQGADDFTITESTIAGTNRSSGSVGEGLRNNYNNPGAVATDDRLEYVGTPFHQGWTVENTYAISNGEEHAAEAGVEHQEDWWISDSTILANHDTLLNPSKQTAVVFAQGGSSSCSNKETITNSLLAGGGYMLYFCAHTSNAGSSSIDIKDDRFARMVCAKTIISDLEGRGGHECSGEPSERISYFDAGEGSGGFYPRGGFFGVVDEGEGLYNKGAGWEGNYWDNNLEAQPEQSN